MLVNSGESDRLIQENFAESNIKQIILFTLITEPKQERVEDILKNAVKTKNCNSYKYQLVQIDYLKH
jgi:hypothetical protein